MGTADCERTDGPANSISMLTKHEVIYLKHVFMGNARPVRYSVFRFAMPSMNAFLLRA